MWVQLVFPVNGKCILETDYYSWPHTVGLPSPMFWCTDTTSIPICTQTVTHVWTSNDNDHRQSHISGKCFWKCCLQNGSHFIQASLCKLIFWGHKSVLRSSWGKQTVRENTGWSQMNSHWRKNVNIHIYSNWNFRTERLYEDNISLLGPLLQTWIKFNPSMDKKIPWPVKYGLKLLVNPLHLWNLEMDK